MEQKLSQIFTFVWVGETTNKITKEKKKAKGKQLRKAEEQKYG